MNNESEKKSNQFQKLGNSVSVSNYHISICSRFDIHRMCKRDEDYSNIKNPVSIIINLNKFDSNTNKNKNKMANSKCEYLLYIRISGFHSLFGVIRRSLTPPYSDSFHLRL